MVKTLILNSCKPEDKFAQGILSELMSMLSESGEPPCKIDLAGKRIADCTGCFRCWTKTPGECTIKDDAPAITALMATSDWIVFFCPVVFGGFHPDLKRVIERSISLLLPFMRVYKGEMHHDVRYRKNYQLCGVGILDRTDPESDASFRKRINRLSLNFNGLKYTAGTVVRDSEDVSAALGSILMNRVTL